MQLPAPVRDVGRQTAKAAHLGKPGALPSYGRHPRRRPSTSSAARPIAAKMVLRWCCKRGQDARTEQRGHPLSLPPKSAASPASTLCVWVRERQRLHNDHPWRVRSLSPRPWRSSAAALRSHASGVIGRNALRGCLGMLNRPGFGPPDSPNAFTVARLGLAGERTPRARSPLGGLTVRNVAVDKRRAYKAPGCRAVVVERVGRGVVNAVPWT